MVCTVSYCGFKALSFFGFVVLDFLSVRLKKSSGIR